MQVATKGVPVSGVSAAYQNISQARVELDASGFQKGNQGTSVQEAFACLFWSCPKFVVQ